MGKNPTVVDVARRAEVGASTVSRFLRGVPVRRNVQGRITAAIAELGYLPNQAAQALRAGRSRTIGVLLPKISNAFFSEATQLMEEEARAQGSTLILLTHMDQKAVQREHLLTLRRYRADGLILVATPGTTLSDVREALPEVPLVAFDSDLDPAVDSVLLRNREAARTATEHLLGHGHRRLLCVGAKPGVYSIRERAAGYSQAMQANGLAAETILPEDYEQLRLQLGAALRRKDRPGGILALSDFATQHVLATYVELGMGEQEQLPMIGFDDFRFAALLRPALTVVRQPVEKMARYALRTLFQRIEGPACNEVQQISLPGELVQRRSCGCK